MTREQAHQDCLSRDCSCVLGKDRDNNYHETIDKIFDHFESRNCSTCKFWNIPDITEIYGVDVCSQFGITKFNRKDRALVKIRTEADFCCSLWESTDN